jgi:hypothetical protein
VSTPAEVKSATWWLLRRFELDTMAERVQRLRFDAAFGSDWQARLRAVEEAIASAVRHADERAASFVPDELERRELRARLHAEALGARP